jgi:hypothetical protein
MAVDDEAATCHKNRERGDIGRKDNHGNQGGKKPKNAHADRLGFGVCGKEFLIFVLLRIQKADQVEPRMLSLMTLFNQSMAP